MDDPQVASLYGILSAQGMVPRVQKLFQYRPSLIDTKMTSQLVVTVTVPWSVQINITSRCFGENAPEIDM